MFLLVAPLLLCHRRLYSLTRMTKSALVAIADGSEEMEAVITIDVLRRAGINVTVGGLGNKSVKCSRGVVIQADALVSESDTSYDVIVLPGGLGGSKAFASSSVIGDLLKKQEASGKVIAAICAAPTALKAHGVATGKRVTSYPSMADEMKSGGNYKYCEDRVVIDGNLITSRGPGTAFEFALAIVEHLLGKEKAEETRKPLLLQ